jgi:hypothetical protein
VVWDLYRGVMKSREPKEPFRTVIREVYFVALHLLRLPLYLLRNCKVALSSQIGPGAVLLIRNSPKHNSEPSLPRADFDAE